MTNAHRRKMQYILAHVMGENFSVEQLDIILHTCIALTFDEKTDSIARAAYGLVKEIIHRESFWHGDQEPRPWQMLLPCPISTATEMRRDAEFDKINLESQC